MCNEIPFTVEKDFRLQLPSGIEPALNPHSATGRIERQRDRVTANQRDGQITRERDRGREGEMKTVLLTLQQLHF